MKIRNLGFLGYPDYEVDDQGNVWSLNYGGNTGERRMMKLGINSCGYQHVVLCNNGKKKDFQVHQLVGKAFLGDWSMWGLEINHKDENKLNNSMVPGAENLEWCTHKHNCNYGTRNERISKEVNQYTKDGEFIRTFNSLTEASEITGVKISNISNCITGKRKSAGNFIWKYKDISS